VCGGRDFDDAGLLYSTLDILHATNKIKLVIHGAAKGADDLAEWWAYHNRVLVMRFPISKEEWRTVGPSAGPRRNKKMILLGKPDLVVAFPGGDGTADMVKQASKHSIRISKIEGSKNVE
jgi:hypothetical protein